MWYLLIRDVIDALNICIYQPPTEVDDEASAEHVRILAEAMPFSIIGSTEDVQTPDGRVIKGRELRSCVAWSCWSHITRTTTDEQGKIKANDPQVSL